MAGDELPVMGGEVTAHLSGQALAIILHRCLKKHVRELEVAGDEVHRAGPSGRRNWASSLGCGRS